MKQSTFSAVMANKLLTVLQGYSKTIRLLLVMLLTLTVSANAWGEEKTYTHIFTTKPSIGNNTLSTITWSVEATSLNGYNNGYAGVQFGTKNTSGSITLTSANAWGEQSNTSYTGYTNVKYVYVWLNAGTGTPTATVTIGGKAASKSGTVSKNTTANGNYENTSKLTFTPTTGGNTGVIKIACTSSKASYIAAIEVVCETPAASCTSIDPSLSYTPSSLSVDGTANPTLSGNIGNGTVTYTSSDPSVATVDASTGVVTAKTVGTTIITATIAENDGYCDGTATATIKVNKPSATIVLSEAGTENTVSGTFYEDESYILPSSTDATCGDKVLVGWSTVEIDETDTKPTSNYYDKGTSVSLKAGNNKFYAVFADQEGFDGNIDFCNQGWAAGQDLDKLGGNGILQCGDVTITFLLNGAKYPPQYIKDGNTEVFAVRLYPKNQMTVSASSNIESITFTHASGEDANTISCSSGSFLGTKWTGNTTSVTFTIGGDSGHRRITNINVEIAGGTVTYSNYTTSCTTTYTVDYVLYGGTGGCEDARVEEGGSHTICNDIPTRTGYTFQGWKYNDTETIYNANHTFTNIQADITLVAQWNPITYSVVFDANEGTGTMDPQPFTYDVAQTLTPNTFTRDKYEFAGWNTAKNGLGTSYDDEEEVKNLTTENGATITLYAQWQKLYTVTFYNMGSVYTTKTQESVGGSITFPEAPSACEGYTFDGWSATEVDGVTSYEAVTTITPNEDTQLYAVYGKTEDGGGTTIQSIKTYQDGIYYLIDSFTDANSKTTYHSPKGTNAGKLSSVDLTNFVTIEDGILTLDITSNSLTEDMKYTISKENDTYKIYNAETEAYVEPSASGTNFKKTSASGWSIDDENNRFMFYYISRAFLYQDSYNSSGTKIYGRQFGNYASSVAGTITNQSGKECYGSGYFFLVPATGGSTTTYTTTPDCCTPLDEITGLTFSAMTRSITVSVPDSYDNTNVDGYIFNLYNAATGGVATTYDTNDKNEKSHTFTGLTPNIAYYFTIIAKGSGEYCNSEETSPRESYTTLPQYSVTWKPNGGNWSGSTADKVDTYDYQAEITKPANPERKGYTFNGWDKTPATIMPAEDLTYTAQWNIETYTITYENLNDATHTNPKEYTVETAAITLTDPTERAGYVFAGWYSDANYTTKVTQIPQGSTGDITLYAKWLEIFTITWMVNGEVSSTKEVVEGEPITPPASPDPGDYCGQVFAGWTDAEMAETSVAAPTLYPTPNPFPKASADATFYAVFADYKEQ